MKEVTGDIMSFTEQPGIVLIPTNCQPTDQHEAIMGGGVARLFADKYPHLPEILGRHLDTQNRMFPVRLEIFPSGCELWAFPTKDFVRDLSDPHLILHGLGFMNAYLSVSLKAHIYSTRPGCGLGGLDWKDVKPMMQSYCDDRWAVVFPGNG